MSPVLRATVGEPALLDLERGPLPLTVPRPEPPPKPPGPDSAPPPPPPTAPPPLSLAELEAKLAQATAEADAPEEEPPAGSAEEEPAPPPADDAEAEQAFFGVALSEEAVIFDRARTALEDLALLGAMRRPLDDQGWEGRAEPERRLLARVDAIAACGEEVLPRLVELLGDRPVPDPDLVWALVFLFGSLAGEDALAQAMLLAHVAPVSEPPEVLPAVADALALAPHPGIDAALRPWLGDPAPERRAAAVRVLARRGLLSTPEALAAARDPDARVAATGSAALAWSAGPVEAGALWEIAHRGEEAVARGAIEAALVRRFELAPRRARKLVEEGRPDFAGAAVLLALSSGPECIDALRQAAVGGSPGALEALGWHGHPAAVELLLEQMEGPQAAIAVGALQRITGASLADEDPDPAYPPDALPFSRPDGPIPQTGVLSGDPEVWRSWWRRHGRGVRPEVRYRFGHPWSLLDDLHEMEAPFSVRRDRRHAHLEACARSGTALAIDPDAFVARQRRQLAAWAASFSSRVGSAGTWPVRLRR